MIRVYFTKRVPDDIRQATRWTVGHFKKMVGAPRRLSVHVTNTMVLVEPDGHVFIGRCSLLVDGTMQIHLAGQAGLAKKDRTCFYGCRVDPNVPREDVLTLLVFYLLHELVHYDWNCRGKVKHNEGWANRRAIQLMRKMPLPPWRTEPCDSRQRRAPVAAPK